MEPKEILKKLSEPFPANEINWRIGATNKDKNKGIALAYLDSRMVMRRLDEVVGIENWQCKYPILGICELSLRINGEWITKSNGAGETQVEKEKGQASDSFKRAAVLFGIGQYLYDLKNNWVEIEPDGRGYKLKSTTKLPAWALPQQQNQAPIQSTEGKLPLSQPVDNKPLIPDKPKAWDTMARSHQLAYNKQYNTNWEVKAE